MIRNGLITLIEKMIFMLIPISGERIKYIIKNKHRFRHMSDNLFFQSRTFPTESELIYWGNNVNIDSDAEFINY